MAPMGPAEENRELGQHWQGLAQWGQAIITEHSGNHGHQLGLR